MSCARSLWWTRRSPRDAQDPRGGLVSRALSAEALRARYPSSGCADGPRTTIRGDGEGDRSMTTATRSAMRRRLGAHLACVGAAAGAVWGALGVSLADDGAARAALSQESDGSAGRIALLVALLSAIPLGSLLGAPVLDLVSHVAGRRSAVLAAGVLVALGAAVGVAPGSWTAVPSGAVTGLGIGGYAIVVPKLAHELSVRGHRRLVPRVRALAPAGAGLTLVASACGGAIAPGQSRACAWAVPASLALAGSALAMGLPETPHWYAAWPTRRRLRGAQADARSAGGRSRHRLGETGRRHAGGAASPGGR